MGADEDNNMAGLMRWIEKQAKGTRDYQASRENAQSVFSRREFRLWISCSKSEHRLYTTNIEYFVSLLLAFSRDCTLCRHLF